MFVRSEISDQYGSCIDSFYPDGRAVKAWVCGRAIVAIVGSNPTEAMEVFRFWIVCFIKLVFCVLSWSLG
jgi:hypothetical protein